jgi:hypothetical protein
MMIGVNVGWLVSFVLMADQRWADVEHQIEDQIEERLGGVAAWRGELAAARSELGVAVADLRSELTELRSEVSTDDGDLRSGLDALGRRVDRVESMMAVLWRAPSSAAQELQPN